MCLPEPGIVVTVLANEEVDPDYVGDLSLVDHESESWLPVSLSDDRLAIYRKRTDRWLDDVRGRCSEVGGRYLRIRADADIVSMLLGEWRAAGVLR